MKLSALSRDDELLQSDQPQHKNVSREFVPGEDLTVAISELLPHLTREEAQSYILASVSSPDEPKAHVNAQLAAGGSMRFSIGAEQRSPVTLNLVLRKAGEAEGKHITEDAVLHLQPASLSAERQKSEKQKAANTGNDGDDAAPSDSTPICIHELETMEDRKTIVFLAKLFEDFHSLSGPVKVVSSGRFQKVTVKGNVLQLLPEKDFNGYTSIILAHEDGERVRYEEISVQVAPVNDVPVVVRQIADRVYDAGTKFFIDYGSIFADSDSPKLTVSVLGLEKFDDFIGVDRRNMTITGIMPEKMSAPVMIVAQDEHGAKASVLFKIATSEQTNPLKAYDDEIRGISAGDKIEISLAQLVANDIAVPGHSDRCGTVQYDAITTLPRYGRISAKGDGSGDLLYTASDRFLGLDSFEYLATDGIHNARATVYLFGE
ncbi:Ig-like domain-containing protein [Limoniibacter endophyticus]|nr:Ig-like domain-containing protein [Limoniibacter endophyticus]